MKFFFILLIILKSSLTFSQVPVNTFTPKEKLYLQTLQRMANYLKSKPTKYFAFHQTETYSNDEAFYDTVIAMFFNKEKMLKNFEKNTEISAVEGKLDIVRHILKGCDYYIDIVPADSFYIRAIHHTQNDLSKENIYPELEIFFRTEGKEIIILNCIFDDETNKLLGFNIIGTPDDESVYLNRFLKRQKNYHDSH